MLPVRKLTWVLVGLLLCQGAMAQPKPGNLWGKLIKAVSEAESREAHAARNAFEHVSKNAVKGGKKEGFSKILGLKILTSKKKALQESFDKEVHYSVFQVLDKDKEPLGTGFVFVRPGNAGQIWAAAAGHLTKQIGQKVPVRFYIGEDEYLPAFSISSSKSLYRIRSPP